MAIHEGVWFAPSEPDAAAGLKTLTRRAAWARSDGGSVSSRHVVRWPRAAALLEGCCCCWGTIQKKKFNLKTARNHFLLCSTISLFIFPTFSM